MYRCHVMKKHCPDKKRSDVHAALFITSTCIFCTMKVQLLSACALLVLATQCSAFGVVVPLSATRSRSTSLNIFGNLKGAFSNDDSLGKVDATPGLKGVSGMDGWLARALSRSICIVPHLLIPCIHSFSHCQRTCCGRDQTSATAPSTASPSRQWPAKRCRRWPQRHE